jgi:dipeptidase
MKRLIGTFAAILMMLAAVVESDACSNLIITKGATKDGSVMVTYSADSHVLYGELYFTPAGVFPKGSKLKVFEWDGGHFLGEIAQVPKTYSTMGNMNEHQLIITETTFGGREELVDTTGIIDYGSLIYITLQRAKTAREAIQVMTSLVEEYGYCSSGESFSIADKNEAWILEMIGKGTRLNAKGENGNKGAVWVAIRIPDGYISAHANQSRIDKIPFSDTENCLYAKDVVSFAREAGLYEGTDEDFSFCDTYAPADFSALRACEARVWAAFNILGGGMIGDKPAMDYFDFASGANPANKMPLYIKPAHKLTVKEVADVMRDHYENTPLDMRKDIGAGGFELPYRWRPSSFEVDSVRYTNERAIATQQTGFWLLGQARNWLPDEIGGILWFGVDDAATSCLTPIYSSGLKAPNCFAVGNGSMLEYSPTSAFWLFNRVAQFAYLRYNLLAPEVQKAAAEHELGAMKIIPTVDAEALRIYKTKPAEVKKYLTEWSNKFADRMFKKWTELDQYLLVKYIDGNVKRQNPDGSFQDNGAGKNIPANPIQPGYSEHWKRKVAEDAGERLRVLSQEEMQQNALKKEQPQPEPQIEMVTITGVVRDSTEAAPLIGAFVSVRGVSEEGEEVILYSGKSDASGKYNITVPQNSVLSFKYIGYYEKKVTVTETTELDILLVQNPDELNTIITIID